MELNIFNYVILIIVVISSLGLGALVYFKNSKNKVNILFGLLVVSFIVWIITNFLVDESLSQRYVIIAGKIDFATATLCMAIFLLFCFNFPRASIPSKLNKIKEFIIVVIAIVFTILTYFTDLIVERVDFYSEGIDVVPGILEIPYYLYIFICLVWGCVSLIAKIRKSKGLIKAQLQYVLLGFAVMIFITFVANVILPFVISDLTTLKNFTRFGIYGMLFFVICTSYAIARYRLMDVRLVIQKGIVYSFLFAITVGLYVIIIVLFVDIIGVASDVVPIVSAAVSAILVVFTFKRLEKFFQKISNKIFFKETYSSKEIFKELGEKIGTIAGIKPLLRAVIDIISKSLKIGKVKIILENKILDVYASPLKGGGSENKKNNLFKLSGGNILVNYLKNNKKIIVREELERKIYEEGNEEEKIETEKKIKKELNGMGISLAIPLLFQEDLIGILFLGPKLSQDSYTPQDFDFLNIISHQFAVAINNAQLYSNLEYKVKERTIELENALNKLKRINKEKSEFISIASHQLRTPLTAIKGIIDMIVKKDFGELNGNQVKYLTKAYINCERLIKLVNDLLDISRIEMGKTEMKIKKIHIEDLIMEIIDELGRKAESRNIKIIFKPDKEKALIKIDPDKIRQVIENLIDNAIKYTEKGNITINIQKSYSNIFVSIKDTGMGLTEKEISNLFHKFIRGRYEKDLYVGGMGLGLYIARKIIESHGGKIWCESKGKGHGSIFYFKLPIK